MSKKYLRRGSRATWNAEGLRVVNGQFATSPRRVRVLAVAKGWAMVKAADWKPMAVPVESLRSAR
jgi:hypothetical protein